MVLADSSISAVLPSTAAQDAAAAENGATVQDDDVALGHSAERSS